MTDNAPKTWPEIASGNYDYGYAKGFAAGLEAQGKEIADLRAELDEAKNCITLANNSTFGSLTYFTVANGKTLAEAIEELKAYSGRQWKRAEKAEAALAEALKVMAPFAIESHNYSADEGDGICVAQKSRFLVCELRAAAAFVDKHGGEKE